MALLRLRHWHRNRRVFTTGASTSPAAESLLVPHWHRIGRIRSLAGVPTGHWLALYDVTLRACVQRLSKGTDTASPEVVLDNGLRSVVCALAMREGRLLPTDAEGRVGNQDLWTWAVFSAALLRSVFPVTESHHACARETDPDQPGLPVLANDILPRMGIDWLAEEPDVLKQCSSAIAGRFEEAGDIGSLIAAANHRLGIETQPVVSPPLNDTGRFAVRTPEQPPADTTPEVTSSVRKDSTDASPNPGTAFVHWLRNGMVARSIPINNADSHLHVTPQGLLLVSPAIFEDYDREEWKKVQRRFTRLRLHEKNVGGANVHTYLFRYGHRCGITQGYLLATASETLSGIPLPSPNPHLCRTDGPATPDGGA